MNRNDKIRKMIINALLLGVGAILHHITPAFGLPMQPDFALIMMFIIVILNKGDYKACLISGIITGIFTAMTTKFPGGQLPNMIDKFITVNFAYVTMMAMDKMKVLRNLTEKRRTLVEVSVLVPIGTLVSGLVFLESASIIVGLPAGFLALVIGVVIPAIFINLVVGFILIKIVSIAMNRATA